MRGFYTRIGPADCNGEVLLLKINWKQRYTFVSKGYLGKHARVRRWDQSTGVSKGCSRLVYLCEVGCEISVAALAICGPICKPFNSIYWYILLCYKVYVGTALDKVMDFLKHEC